MSHRASTLSAAVLSLGMCLAAAPTTGPATATRPTLTATLAGMNAPTTAPAAAKPPTTLPTVARNSPATRPAGASGSSPVATTRPVVGVNELQLAILSRRSIGQLEDRRFDDARKTLDQILMLDPHDATARYNLACLDALTGCPALAGEALQRAAEDGFDDFAHMAVDADLAGIRDTPGYRDVIAHQGQYMHRAAERAVAELRKRFGDGYIYEVDDADKLIFATNTDRVTLDALKRDMVRQARSQWQTLFEHHGERYIAVVVPSAADYDRLRPAPNVQGFYSPGTHTLIASGLGFVTTHEFTHALNFGDIEDSGKVQQPIWLTEGLAVLFERSVFKGDVLTPRPNDRLYELQYLQRTNKLIAMDRLLRMRQPVFMRNPGPGYAEAGGIMTYLYDQGKLRAFYDRYKLDYDKDRTGRLAMEQVLQKPLPEIDADWRAWLGKQTPPPLFTGPNGAYVGARFDQANDGLLTDMLTADGPAAKAGLKKGDVLVGLDDVEVRDRDAFVNLLGTHKPGERITLNVRRGKDYLGLPVVLGTRPPLPPELAERLAASTRPTTIPTTGPTATGNGATLAAARMPAATPSTRSSAGTTRP